MKGEFFRVTVISAVCFVLLCCGGCGRAAVTGGDGTAELTQQRETISLAGTWSFRLDRNNVGEKEKWYENELTGRIELPGSVVENGYGDDVSVDTKWTGGIVDRSWFTDAKYEKYRQGGSVKVPFWLTPVKHYVGPAWYRRQMDIPEKWAGKHIVLFLERCHWETKVWVDGRAAGMRDSLCTPHSYDVTSLLTPGRHIITVRVDNSIKYDVGVNAHSVSDHTQTNWNGIIGRIELQATDRVWISDMQVYPDLESGTAAVRVTVDNATGRGISGRLTIRAVGGGTHGKHTVEPKTTGFSCSGPQASVEFDYVLGDGVLLWDEFSPAVYELEVSLAAETDDTAFYDLRSVTFGMRKFSTRGTQFTINDRLTFLRGTLECCIFPLTGYPAMDVEQWTRIFRVCRAHGLNHMRFHSWCPPQAAFEAADRVGIMLAPEVNTWTRLGDDPKIDGFIYAEADRIMQAYGNHPSFCMLAVGNEPSGRGRDAFLSKIVAYWKQKDRRRVYTGTSGWPVTHESDYHSRPQPRGHAWGAGLRSRFNAGRLSTDFDYSDEVSRFSVPIVSHEIGQWCVYPSFREIDKYTGVLKALNFEIFRDSLAEHRMADQAQDFLMASGRLQALLYKEEIEAALRTPGFGGFQLLDIHDFPGQGTALVGVLDPFWDSKGYIEPREYHEFCCEVVPLVRIKKLTWTTDETLRAGVEVANFGPAPIERAVPAWSLNYADGREFASGRLPRRNIEMGNGIESGDITVLLTDVAAPAKLILTVSLTGTPYTNHWDIWVYPAETVVEPPEDIIIADKLDEQVRSALSTGGKVLLMPALQSIDSDIPAGFTTIFWNTQWTNRQPPHTLGILCDPKHPALAKFPTDFHSNWQWWDLVTKSGFMILDRFDPGLRPIVQVIDDWNSNRRLALIFEAEVGGGKLLFCSIDLRSDLGRRPVARQMLHSLLAYMDSDAFSPAETVETELIESLFREPSLLGSSAVINADSEAPGYPGVNAIDGRTDTIWHTPWGEGAAGYPHELSIELQKEVEIQALEYLPRQDMSNGWIREYEVYVSEDGGNWADAVAKGAFAGNRDRKRVVFAEPKRGRFIRFVALSGFDRQIFASVAEIEIVTEPRK